MNLQKAFYFSIHKFLRQRKMHFREICQWKQQTYDVKQIKLFSFHNYVEIIHQVFFKEKCLNMRIFAEFFLIILESNLQNLFLANLLLAHLKKFFEIFKTFENRTKIKFSTSNCLLTSMKFSFINSQAFSNRPCGWFHLKTLRKTIRWISGDWRFFVSWPRQRRRKFNT